MNISEQQFIIFTNASRKLIKASSPGSNTPKSDILCFARELDDALWALKDDLEDVPDMAFSAPVGNQQQASV